MTILTVCEFGINRSRYLAEYLESLGYTTIYGGVREGQDILQKKLIKLILSSQSLHT